MKKVSICILFLLSAVFLTSCEKEMMGYKGKEGVYFSVRMGTQTLLMPSWPYMPYSNVDFVRLSSDVVDFPVNVAITGPVKDYARTFNLEINPDSTTAVLGTHYEPVQREWTIPAGATTAVVKVKLKRTADLQDKEVKLGLRLVATKDFELSFPEWDAIPGLDQGVVVKKFDAGMHTLLINDIMVRPAVWSGSIQPGNRESGLFGVFTRRKMEFLMQNLGLKYEDFASTDSMPMARQMLIASDASLILRQRFDAKNPVLEEDGRLMFIGSVPWTSIIGVPWVP